MSDLPFPSDNSRHRFMARLRGEPHVHHPDCIHHLPADEQMNLRGFTREQWEANGWPEPTVIGGVDE